MLGPQRTTVKSSDIGGLPLLAESSIVANNDLLQDIFEMHALTAIQSSFEHGGKYVLRLL